MMNTIFKLVYYGTNQKTPPANNQRQRLALWVYTNEHAGKVKQSV